MACGAFCTKRDSRKENQADAGLMSVPILSGTLYRQLAEQCAGKSAIRRQGPFDPSRLRSAGDGPDGGGGTSARESDVADADPHGVKPEDLSVLDHFLLLFSRWPAGAFCTTLGLCRKRKDASV